MTLGGLFAFAYLSSINPALCSSFQFQLLAGGFSLGAALAGGFIGGGAGAQGQAGGTGFNIVFGLGGGAALLIVTLIIFSILAPQGCEVIGSKKLQDDLNSTNIELTRSKEALDKIMADLSNANIQRATSEQQNSNLTDQLKEVRSALKQSNNALDQVSARLDNARADLAAVTIERDNTLSSNASAREQIKRLVSTIHTILPDAETLSDRLGSITRLITQSCSGGPHGTDPLHADTIRSISAQASRRIEAAKTAIANIVASVPAELSD